jgi:hypothetical protein
MNYKEIMDDIIEMSNKYTVVSGQFDLVSEEFTYGLLNQVNIQKMVPKDISFYSHLGYADDKEIESSIMEEHFDPKSFLEGTYTFNAMLEYNPSEWEGSNQISRDYWGICHIETVLTQTLTQKIREQAIDSVIEDSNLFDF